MRILFDFISSQSFFANGGAEYVRRVYGFLINYKKKSKYSISVIGIVDSTKPEIVYDDLKLSKLKEECEDIVDINQSSLEEIIKKYSIDKLFIGIAQSWGKYDIDKVDCEIVAVVHDLFQEEFRNARLNEYMAIPHTDKLLFEIIRPKINKLRSLIMHNFQYRIQPMVKVMKALERNPKSRCVTVSNYSKFSILYHFSLPLEKIEVCYSPERLMNTKGMADNKVLRDIIEKSCRYYLIVSAGRPAKNAVKAIHAFDRYRNVYLKNNTTEELPYIVTLGMKNSLCEGHVCLPVLSENDLVCAYKYSYAFVYPSFFEGFGYPPMEAMKFGKPVLASNTTSIPEVLGDSAILFSPMYESDIFKAFCTLTHDNYESYCKKSACRYDEMHILQENALNKLLTILLS